MSNDVPGQPVPPAGWYDDQNDNSIKRFWDGSEWTQHTAPANAAPGPLTQPQPRQGLPRWALWSAIGGGALVLLLIVGIASAASRGIQNASDSTPIAPTVTATVEPESSATPTPTPTDRKSVV